MQNFVLLLLIAGAVAHDETLFPPPFSRVLSFGSKGKDVQILQQLLQRSSFWPSGRYELGTFENTTGLALKAFKAANNLQPTTATLTPVAAALLMKTYSCDNFSPTTINATAPGSFGAGYKYGLYIPLYHNRSVETEGHLVDSKGVIRHTFKVRAHGWDSRHQNPPWPHWSFTNGLNEYTPNGNTMTGLSECDLQTKEPNQKEYGRWPIHRLVRGVIGNSVILNNDTVKPIRTGILMHTGEWPGWEPGLDMPNSAGCLHVHPQDLVTVNRICTEELGVKVRENTFGALPYIPKPQGLLAIWEMDCEKPHI